MPATSTHTTSHDTPAGAANRRLRGRLAPSPTGYLHLGNARSFLLAWLQMRRLGGEIILRIEDLDQARAVAGARDAIVRDLSWLGLDWDNTPDGDFIQSNRFEHYAQAIAGMLAQGLLYECYCSRKELRQIASAPHGHAGDYYPGTCRNLGPAEREQRRALKEPALRFALPSDAVVEFTDLLAGHVTDNLNATTGDFIVARADGVPGYQLAVVLDDIAMGITHVLRGNDLLGSTARQILLHRTFGAPVPLYTHVPLVLGADGARLAKRHGAVSLAELRADGRDPRDVVGWLAWSCGLIAEPAPITPAELIPMFTIAAIGQAPATCLPEQLVHRAASSGA